MRNPFYSTVLSPTAPFCDREKEMKDLTSHALNNANVVLYSPRRYGKTSLVRRVQSQLKGKDTRTVYIDFFGITSAEDVARKLATSLYSIYKRDMSLIRKVSRILSSWRPSITVKPDQESGFVISAEPATRARGLDLLDETLVQFGEFTSANKEGFHVALDEFQEITRVADSIKIEGVLRSHVQSHSNVSYFFIGSRRRLLVDIFNTSRRPFYKSAINYELPPLPKGDAVRFIVERFLAAGRKCPEEIAGRIFDLVNGYPYYIQKIPYAIYELAEGDAISPMDLAQGIGQVYQDEKPLYEASLEHLAPVQRRFLEALAKEPTASPHATAYMARHSLGSVGGVQGAITKLTNLDYIEKTGKTFRVVDPVFALWLQETGQVRID